MTVKSSGGRGGGQILVFDVALLFDWRGPLGGGNTTAVISQGWGILVIGGVLARWASFFDQSPPAPVFAPPSPNNLPQEGRGDVAIPPTRALQGRFAVQCGLLGGLPEMRIDLGLEPGYLIQRKARRECAGHTFPHWYLRC